MLGTRTRTAIACYWQLGTSHQYLSGEKEHIGIRESERDQLATWRLLTQKTISTLRTLYECSQ